MRKRGIEDYRMGLVMIQPVNLELEGILSTPRGISEAGLRLLKVRSYSTASSLDTIKLFFLQIGRRNI